MVARDFKPYFLMMASGLVHWRKASWIREHAGCLQTSQRRRWWARSCSWASRISVAHWVMAAFWARVSLFICRPFKFVGGLIVPRLTLTDLSAEKYS